MDWMRGGHQSCFSVHKVLLKPDFREIHLGFIIESCVFARDSWLLWPYSILAIRCEWLTSTFSNSVNLKRKIFQRNQTHKNCPQRKWDANGMLEWIKEKQTKTFIPKKPKNFHQENGFSPVAWVGLRKKNPTENWGGKALMDEVVEFPPLMR